MQGPGGTILFNLQGPALLRARVDAKPVSIVRLAGAAIVIEELTANDLARIEPDLRMLEARAADANPFYGPDFLPAASRHFRKSLRPMCLAAWRPLVGGIGRRLVGLWPLAAPPRAIAGAASSSWTHPFTALSSPLIDRLECHEVVAAFIDRLRASESVAALLIPQLVADGPVRAAIERVAKADGSRVAVIASGERAVFATALLALDQPGKAGKELRRQARRLAEQGQVTFSVVEGYDELKSGIEEFLALEARGWKGRAGTSLLHHAETANFSRAMLWSAARRGRLRIIRLDLDGRMIAGGLLLSSGTTGFLWKIAYDEAHARSSPGVLLIRDLSLWARKTASFTMIDSCAHAGHSMIEAIWPERRALCDIMLDLAPASPARFRLAVLRETARRRLLRSLKGLRQQISRCFTPVRAAGGG